MSTTSVKPDTTPLPELLDLSGRTAIVTGGGAGIGLGIARRLHEAGAAVVVADLDADAAASAASHLDTVRPGSALGLRADVADGASVDDLVAAAVERFGSVDILVNNAGIYPNVPFTELDAETFRHTIDVNLVGVFLTTQAAARRMIEQGRGGRIINVTSIDAVHPSMIGLSHYDASKHGVWGFTKNIALELAQHGIWVNAIAPGGIRTPGVGEIDEAVMQSFESVIPMRRMGEPDDIARVALFLASDLSDYMTGSQIVVDGGRLLA